MQLNIRQSYGWYNKDVKFYAQRSNGTTVLLATLAYVLTDHTGAGWRGTGTTTITPSPTVDLGDYVRLWVEMTVHDTQVGDRLYSSENPGEAFRYFIDGVQQPNGRAISIATLLPCGRTVSYAVEDSNGDGFALQDMFFDVGSICDVVDPTRTRLKR